MALWDSLYKCPPCVLNWSMMNATYFMSIFMRQWFCMLNKFIYVLIVKFKSELNFGSELKLALQSSRVFPLGGGGGVSGWWPLPTHIDINLYGACCISLAHTDTHPSISMTSNTKYHWGTFSCWGTRESQHALIFYNLWHHLKTICTCTLNQMNLDPAIH